MNLEKAHIILEMVVGPNTTPQNWLVRRGLSPLINTLSGHLISDVGLLTDTRCGTLNIYKLNYGLCFVKNSA